MPQKAFAFSSYYYRHFLKRLNITEIIFDYLRFPLSSEMSFLPKWLL